MYMHICVFVYLCVYIYMYIYVYIREDTPHSSGKYMQKLFILLGKLKRSTSTPVPSKMRHARSIVKIVCRGHTEPATPQPAHRSRYPLFQRPSKTRAANVL